MPQLGVDQSHLSGGRAGASYSGDQRFRVWISGTIAQHSNYGQAIQIELPPGPNGPTVPPAPPPRPYRRYFGLHQAGRPTLTTLRKCAERRPPPEASGKRLLLPSTRYPAWQCKKLMRFTTATEPAAGFTCSSVLLQNLDWRWQGLRPGGPPRDCIRPGLGLPSKCRGQKLSEARAIHAKSRAPGMGLIRGAENGWTKCAGTFGAPLVSFLRTNYPGKIQGEGPMQPNHRR